MTLWWCTNKLTKQRNATEKQNHLKRWTHKNTRAEKYKNCLRHSIESFKSRLNHAEKRINDSGKDRTCENIQSEKKEWKEWRKPMDTMKRNNIHIMKPRRVRQKVCWKQKIYIFFKKLYVKQKKKKDFPKTGAKATYPDTRSPNYLKQGESRDAIPIHAMITLSKVKDKRSLIAARKRSYIRENPIRLSADILSRYFSRQKRYRMA